ncbi:MAG: hypothetical protein HFJ25_06435, partial [Clostridia bacterium]|nr:hypothetical protein [Clostridia bacterium]
RYTKEIEPEMKNIAKLKRIMDDYIEGKLPSIKIVLLEDFSNELGNILSLYQEEEEIIEEPVQKSVRPKIEAINREEIKHPIEEEETTIRQIEEATRIGIKHSNNIEIAREIEPIEEIEETEEEVEDTRPQFLKSIEKYYNSRNWDDDSEE